MGVDRATALTGGDMVRLRAAYGAEWTGVYIGGSCSAGRLWSPIIVENLAQLGFAFLPIWVGPQSSDICRDSELTKERGIKDAEDCLIVLDVYGFANVHPVPCAIDVEYGTYEAHPYESIVYANAWAERISQAGYAPILYGSQPHIEETAQLNSYFKGFWLAKWVRQGPDKKLRVQDAGLRADVWNELPMHAWQYSGGFLPPELASACDWSVAEFPLATTRAVLATGLAPYATTGNGEYDPMTDQQLNEIVGAIKGAAHSTMVWLARQQRGLDVVTGKKFDATVAPADTDVQT